MAIIISLLITIVGGVVCHFIIKWLDSDDKGNKQPRECFVTIKEKKNPQTVRHYSLGVCSFVYYGPLLFRSCLRQLQHMQDIFAIYKFLSFRSKKQVFRFEDFRVRKLAAINALNFYITLCMAFLAQMSMKSETNALKVSIIKTADPVRQNVQFCYYRLAKGICGILSYAREGIRLWFRTKRPAYHQLCLRLTA